MAVEGLGWEHPERSQKNYSREKNFTAVRVWLSAPVVAPALSRHQLLRASTWAVYFVTLYCSLYSIVLSPAGVCVFYAPTTSRLNARHTKYGHSPSQARAADAGNADASLARRAGEAGTHIFALSMHSSPCPALRAGFCLPLARSLSIFLFWLPSVSGDSSRVSRSMTLINRGFAEAPTVSRKEEDGEQYRTHKPS